MEIIRDSLDNILTELYPALIREGLSNKGSRGDTLELLGVAIRLTKPRARLSRSENRGKPFSALGELLWYFSGSNKLEFIKPYISRYEREAEADGTIRGAYGPRLFSMRGSIMQLDNVLALFKLRQSTKRAVIQLFDAEDIAPRPISITRRSQEYKEIPCTTALQFLLRDGLLHMATTMRSNDAYKGLPHDVFCFTMIQEIVATVLAKDLAIPIALGEYYHYVGSMHIYDEDIQKAEAFLKEGFQKLEEMPQMSPDDPLAAMRHLITIEAALRSGRDESLAGLPGYWADLARLLQAFWASGDAKKIDQIKAGLVHDPFREFIESRKDKDPKTFCSAAI